MSQIKPQVISTPRLRREAMWAEVKKVVDSELFQSFEAYITSRCALDARHDLQEFMFALLWFGLAVFHAFFSVSSSSLPEWEGVPCLTTVC